MFGGLNAESAMNSAILKGTTLPYKVVTGKGRGKGRLFWHALNLPSIFLPSFFHLPPISLQSSFRLRHINSILFYPLPSGVGNHKIYQLVLFLRDFVDASNSFVYTSRFAACFLETKTSKRSTDLLSWSSPTPTLSTCKGLASPNKIYLYVQRTRLLPFCAPRLPAFEVQILLHNSNPSSPILYLQLLDLCCWGYHGQLGLSLFTFRSGYLRRRSKARLFSLTNLGRSKSCLSFLETYLHPTHSTFAIPQIPDGIPWAFSPLALLLFKPLTLLYCLPQASRLPT